MSKFDELSAMHVAWGKAHLQHEQDAAQLVRDLAVGFAKYIEAPRGYTGQEGEVIRYVDIVKAITDDETGGIKYCSPKHGLDVVTRDQPGFWMSGINVTLDYGVQGTFAPKTIFQFFLSFSLRDRQCELSVDRTSEKFKLNIDNLDEMEPVYEHMFQVLRKILETNPWDGSEKSPIGFAIPTPVAE